MRSCNVKFHIEDLTVKASLHNSRRGEQAGPLHFHPAYELQYVNEGDFLMDIEKKQIQLTEGTLLVIAPRIFHQSYGYEESSERFSVDLSLERNKNSGGTFAEYQRIFQCVNGYVQIPLELPELREIKTVLSRSQAPLRADEQQVVQAYFTAAFFKIGEALTACLQSEAEEAVQDGTRGFDHKFGGAVIDFIVGHYDQDITVAALADSLGFSVRQTERIIQKNMTSTFSRLLNEYRIQIAKRMILNEREMTLEEIGYAVGYHDYHCFLKQFKRFASVTPSAYRREIH